MGYRFTLGRARFLRTVTECLLRQASIIWTPEQSQLSFVDSQIVRANRSKFDAPLPRRGNKLRGTSMYAKGFASTSAVPFLHEDAARTVPLDWRLFEITRVFGNASFPYLSAPVDVFAKSKLCEHIQPTVGVGIWVCKPRGQWSS